MSTQSSQAAKTWLKIHQQLADGRAIRNVQTQFLLERIGDDWVPATLNQTDYENSYVCSTYTAYISYAKQELPLLKRPLLEKGAAMGLLLAGVWLKAAKINQTLSINNWLFSTNLPKNWSATDLHTATQGWIKRTPNHSIQIRSLNRAHHQSLIDTLKSQKWLLLPARQVFLFDGQQTDWWQRNNCKNDQRLLRKTPLQFVSNAEFNETDYPQIEWCFNQLFIEKHSIYNPQFTADYYQQLHQSGLVEFEGFRDHQGHIIGVVGYFIQQNIITSPILGYDTQQPKSLGLYRLLITQILKRTHESGMAMNLSSGAGHFKALRGGQAEIEYCAFYVNHLPKRQRWLLKAFAKLISRPLKRLFSTHIF